jgi:hypothetical protein
MVKFEAKIVKIDMNPDEILEQWLAAINRYDASAPAALMGADHVFVDSLGNRVTGGMEGGNTRRQSCGMAGIRGQQAGLRDSGKAPEIECFSFISRRQQEDGAR